MITTSVSRVRESQPLLSQGRPSPLSNICDRIQRFVMGEPNNSSYSSNSPCFYGSLGGAEWTQEPDIRHWEVEPRDPALLAPPFGYIGATWHERSISRQKLPVQVG